MTVRDLFPNDMKNLKTEGWMPFDRRSRGFCVDKLVWVPGFEQDQPLILVIPYFLG
jgi:hypothetical protein